MAYLIGQTIDHYRVEAQLGQGGMGIIYQATDIATNRAVALKVMHGHLSSNQQFKERFLQEARTVSGLDHPNIVRVLEFNPSPQRLYIVMELVTGGSLRDHLTKLQREGTPLEFIFAVQWVRQIADALHYAHEHSMIHRDVKPENILLKPAGEALQAMLTDFGLAKLTEGIGFTVTGKPLGTFTYMSPEQCLAQKDIDRRTDLYALGIVLYELTVGRLPYQPKNIMEALRMHTQVPPPLPHTLIDDYPQPLEDIVLKCLAKNRDERFANAKELSSALWDYELSLKEQFDTDIGALPEGMEQLATDVGADEPQEAQVGGVDLTLDIMSQAPTDAPVEVPAILQPEPPAEDEEERATQEEESAQPLAAPPAQFVDVEGERATQEEAAAEPPPLPPLETIDDEEDRSTQNELEVVSSPPVSAVADEDARSTQEEQAVSAEVPAEYPLETVEDEDARSTQNELQVAPEIYPEPVSIPEEQAEEEFAQEEEILDVPVISPLETLEDEEERSTQNELEAVSSPPVLVAEDEDARSTQEEAEVDADAPVLMAENEAVPVIQDEEASPELQPESLIVEEEESEPPLEVFPDEEAESATLPPDAVVAAPPLDLLPLDDEEEATDKNAAVALPPPKPPTQPPPKAAPPPPLEVLPTDDEEEATDKNAAVALPPPKPPSQPPPKKPLTQPPPARQRIVIPPVPQAPPKPTSLPPSQPQLGSEKATQPPPKPASLPPTSPRAVVPTSEDEISTGLSDILSMGPAGSRQAVPDGQSPIMAEARIARDTNPLVEAPPDDADANIDRLLVYQSDQVIRNIPLTRTNIVIGRDTDNDVVLLSKKVSRRHLRIEQTPEGDYRVVDMGATNRSRLDDLRLPVNTPVKWEFGQTLYVGEFILRLEPAPSRSMSGEREGLDGLSQAIPQRSSYLNVTMLPNNVKAEPGSVVELQLKIHNNSAFKDRLKLEVRGLAGDWAVIADDTLDVDAGDTAFTTLTFSPPRKWTSRAGRHFFTLRVHSIYEQNEVAVANGILHLTALQDFNIELHPKRLHNSGDTQLTITNQGNVTSHFSIQARDNENNLEFAMNYTRLRLEPGKSETLTIRVLPRQQALIHGAKLLPFEVGVTSDNLQQKWEQAEVLVVAYLVSQQPVPISGFEPARVPLPEYAASIPYQPPVLVPPRERGGALTLWLIMHTLLSLSVFIGLGIFVFTQYNSPSLEFNRIFFFVLLLTLGLFGVIYALLVLFTWTWKRWALIGLLSFSLFVIPIGPILTFIGWLLVREKWQMFD